MANIFRDSASQLAQLGLAVFQLKHRSKHPATKNGFKDATKDLTEIHRRDWGGVAVATGIVSGVCVVDIDPRNGGDEEAVASLPGPLPPTWECLTGGGGRHLYYRITGPVRTHKLVAGGAIDVRGDGSYVVAPPSIHPDTGKAYEWELSNVPGECPPAMAPEWLIEVPAAAEVPPSPLSAADPSRLSQHTALFLQFGASEGERNNRLFAAACDMAGCGFSLAAAQPILATAAARCGLSAEEAYKTIQSAFAAPRSPAVPVVTIPEHLQANGAIVPARQVVIETPPKSAPDPATGPRVKPSTPANRFRISNLTDAEKEVKGKKVPITLHRGVETIADDLLTASGGWPKAASGVLFVERATARGPEVRWLTDTDGIFAWMHERFNVRWGSGGSKRPVLCPNTGAILTAPTKGEFIQTLAESMVERYAAVYELPHEPRMPGIYYLGIDLPDATGQHLNEYLAMMNPETDADAAGLRAMILTGGWGGEPGTRPLFALQSKYGMGAGKSSTAYAIGRIWGYKKLDNDAKWADQAKTIMSSADRNARCFIFDNVQGRFGGAAIEGALTAETLTGWRSYVGDVSRPNDAMYIATVNGPEFSADLAQRSVIINIGAPKHGVAFVAKCAKYHREFRLNIVADCLAELRKPRSGMVGIVDDRYQQWVSEVLGAVPGGAAAAKVFQDRRPAADADAEDREAWVELIAQMCNGSVESETTAADIHKKAVEAKLWQPAKDKSESHNRQACLRRAERLLAGLGALEAKSRDGQKRRALDATGTLRSRVYGIKPAASPDGGGGVEGPILNIPV